MQAVHRPHVLSVQTRVHMALEDSLPPPIHQRPMVGRQGAHRPGPGELGAPWVNTKGGFLWQCPPTPCPEGKPPFSLEFQNSVPRGQNLSQDFSPLDDTADASSCLARLAPQDPVPTAAKSERTKQVWKDRASEWERAELGQKMSSRCKTRVHRREILKLKYRHYSFSA